MLTFPKPRRMLIESTAMGIDAETVSPARSPTYTVTAPKNNPARIPSRIARSVNSGRFCSAGTYGRNSSAGAVELHGLLATAHPRSSTLSRRELNRDAGHYGLLFGAGILESLGLRRGHNNSRRRASASERANLRSARGDTRSACAASAAASAGSTSRAYTSARRA